MMHQLFRSLRVKSTSTFRDDLKKDPLTFCKKALDYIEAGSIDEDDMTDECKHCLEGKAHVWYNEIIIPEDWDDLMDMFCRRFCIYGRASEDWYQQWNKISYDLNSDVDIEEFISEIKSLKNLLGLPDHLVVTIGKVSNPQVTFH